MKKFILNVTKIDLYIVYLEFAPLWYLVAIVALDNLIRSHVGTMLAIEIFTPVILAVILLTFTLPCVTMLVIEIIQALLTLAVVNEYKFERIEEEYFLECCMGAVEAMPRERRDYYYDLLLDAVHYQHRRTNDRFRARLSGWLDRIGM